MSEIINLHAAKTHLSRLVDRAAGGEEIIIARDGQPVARLVALRSTTVRRIPGLLKGRIEIAEDFDAPLPEETLAGFLEGAIEPSQKRRR
jgi:prevent-host-death family protein